MAGRTTRGTDPLPVDTHELDPQIGEGITKDVPVTDHSGEHDADVRSWPQAPDVTSYGDEQEG